MAEPRLKNTTLLYPICCYCEERFDGNNWGCNTNKFCLFELNQSKLSFLFLPIEFTFWLNEWVDLVSHLSVQSWPKNRLKRFKVFLTSNATEIQHHKLIFERMGKNWSDIFLPKFDDVFDGKLERQNEFDWEFWSHANFLISITLLSLKRFLVKLLWTSK